MKKSTTTILVTNDDGIESPLLKALVAALARKFRVAVAAPQCEQSWIGRAISRRRKVSVRIAELPNAVAAWAIDGTPTDCVNIALGHLLPEQPQAVVSGINIGFNCCTPLLLSSGTLAGAVEGASWGLPALAFSLHLEPAAFAHAQQNPPHLSPEVQKSLDHAAEHAAAMVAKRLSGSDRPGIVDNINFPSVTTPATPVRRTRPARVNTGPLFRRDKAGDFHFHWGLTGLENPAPGTDMAVICDGCISHSRIDVNRFAI